MLKILAIKVIFLIKVEQSNNKKSIPLIKKKLFWKIYQMK